MFTKLFIIRMLILSFFLIGLLIFVYINTTNYRLSDFLNIYTILMIPISVIFHECLHAIGFFFYNFSFKNISFGFSTKFIPYTRINSNIPKKNFIIATLFPFLILGFLPSIIALFYYHPGLITFSIVNIASSIGDLLIFANKIKS